MRINLKVVLVCLCLAVFFITITFWSRCGDLSLPKSFLPKWDSRRFYEGNQQGETIEEIECLINQKYSVSCRREGDEVYLPFSFLHDYFEVFGTISSTVKGTNRFEWSHTNAKVNYPKEAYDPKGIFMYFENYNVEMRDRVKCISASDGVPLSTQWQTQAYYYPTQIAQFGLSHYSKNLTDPEPRKKIIEDAEKDQSEWIVPKGSNLTRQYDGSVYSNVVSYTTPSLYESAVMLPLDHVLDLVMSVDVLLKVNSSSLIVMLQNRETKKTFNLHYIVADLMLSIQGENFYYGIGSNINDWKHLTRDLLVDLQKGIQAQSNSDKKKKHRRTEIKVVGISFLGTGSFDNLTFATSEHIAQFYDAAEWFVRHQDSSGGWPNPVKRKLSEFAELKAGWYSAMGQGHAISLLSRAYHHSNGDQRYLKAAVDGLKPFRVPSKQGGVLAKFLGKLDWYEEYPTSPPSFVLNGFIYSLLGLYDLNATVPALQSRDAGRLYEQGMISLKKMLLLFDTGSGTIYDLRHFTLGIGPNIARWDYHATHVNQLLLLAKIHQDPLISRTAERWHSYMYGKRSPHN